MDYNDLATKWYFWAIVILTFLANHGLYYLLTDLLSAIIQMIVTIWFTWILFAIVLLISKGVYRVYGMIKKAFKKK